MAETPTDLPRAADGGCFTDTIGDESSEDARAEDGKSHDNKQVKFTFDDNREKSNNSNSGDEPTENDKMPFAECDTLHYSADDTDMASNPERTTEKDLQRENNDRSTQTEEQTDQNHCGNQTAKRDMSGDENDGESFEYRAALEYDNMFKQMQIWCRFQAEMHLMEASWFESRCFYLEITAAILGALSLTSIMAFMAHWIPSGEDTHSIWTRFGITGFVGVAIAGILEFVCKGSAELLPTFHKRADEHRKAAFSWQHLKHDIRSIRLQLRNPARYMGNITSEYTNCVLRRMKLSEKILVSSSTTARMDNRHDRNDILEHELKYLLTWPVPGEKYSVTLQDEVQSECESGDFLSESGSEHGSDGHFISVKPSNNARNDKFCNRFESAMRKSVFRAPY